MRNLAMILRSLWKELRRRKVFRVAAAYLGGAFVVLEGAQLTFGSIGVPDWGYTALVVLAVAGLPLALVLSWLFDLTPDGVQRTGGEETGPNAARAPRLVRGRLRLQTGAAAVLLLLLLTLGAAAVAWRFFRAPDPSREMIAVLPFEVRGGTELDYLSEGMVDLLARNMDGVAGLRTLAPATVLSAAAEGAEGPLAPAAAAHVARALGAGLFVLGSVFQSPGTVRIDASIFESGEGPRDPLHTARTEGSPGDLLALVDDLSGQLLAGVRPGQHAARLARTAATTTSSLNALRDYLTGEQALRSAEYDSAIVALERAVASDGGFALAHYRLAVAALSEGRYDLARRASRRAIAAGERLSERDHALVAAFDAPLYGRLDEAERRYRAILRDYPDDMEAIYQLGEVLWAANPLRADPIERAGSLYNKVLESDPEFLCPI
jgi:tetratricopeptide (TPR) repeat protein